MTPIAPHITAFLQQRCPSNVSASHNTCDSYAYAFQLLFELSPANVSRWRPRIYTWSSSMRRWCSTSSPDLEMVRGNAPARETSAWPPSRPLCTSWNIACPRRWSRSGAFWRFRPRKPSRVWSSTSRVKRCSVSWMRPIPQNAMASAIAPCYICASREHYASPNLIGLQLSDLTLQPQPNVTGPWKRPQTTVPAVVERNRRGASSLAGGQGYRTGAGTIPQRPRRMP